ncbi:hypothetical protein GCM10023350_23510 [Nocardioides endophyticus]|uniref:Thioesterase family protein n=1 Tax=Nocardioides endophyticus TaxID=1353775 RepID=A0ABP8YV62_9ACTN
MPDVLVPRRFCGPPSSGNGGFTAGALAALVGGSTASVSLLAPPPLDTPMSVEVVDGATIASVGDAPVARAEVAAIDQPAVDPVTPEEARSAEQAFVGLASHPFPTCFVCGPDRPDGLRIFPGPVADQDGLTRLAATWTPDESVADDLSSVTWSALDCIGGWAGGLADRTMVLARMTAQVDVLPRIGEEHVVVGVGRRTEGRKTFTAAALYDSDGRLLGRAEHLWLAVDRAAFA